MSHVKKFVLCAIILVGIASVYCQDCRTPGQSCSDTEYCCGGCCRGRVCIQTTDLCYESYDDLCLEHECPPGMTCHVFQPKCEGCEPQAECG